MFVCRFPTGHVLPKTWATRACVTFGFRACDRIKPLAVGLINMGGGPAAGCSPAEAPVFLALPISMTWTTTRSQRRADQATKLALLIEAYRTGLFHPDRRSTPAACPGRPTPESLRRATLLLAQTI